MSCSNWFIAVSFSGCMPFSGSSMQYTPPAPVASAIAVRARNRSVPLDMEFARNRVPEGSSNSSRAGERRHAPLVPNSRAQALTIGLLSCSEGHHRDHPACQRGFAMVQSDRYVPAVRPNARFVGVLVRASHRRRFQRQPPTLHFSTSCDSRRCCGVSCSHCGARCDRRCRARPSSGTTVLMNDNSSEFPIQILVGCCRLHRCENLVCCAEISLGVS